VTPAELRDAYIRSVVKRVLAQQQAEKINRLFKRPGNLKRAASSSVSELTLVSVADRLQARQLAEILAGAYKGLGLDHYGQA
jgi:hypothetical protein